MTGVLSPYTVTIGSTKFNVVASPDVVDQDVPAAYSGSFQPQDQAKLFTQRDVALDNLNFFGRGCGVLRRTGDHDDGKLAWFENGYGHLGALQPSGKLSAGANGLGLCVAASAPTSMAVTGSAFFNGDLFCITSGALVIRLPNADPQSQAVIDPALNTFSSANQSLHSGYLCTGIATFRRTTGEPALYVSAYNNGIPASRIYEYALSVSGSHWTASPAFTNYKIEKLASVWWQGRDGVGAARLAGVVTDITGGAPSATKLVANQIRHVIGGQDPLASGATTWVTPIVIGSGAFAINSLVPAGQHLIPICGNGIHDFDEQRAFNLTKYWETTASFNNGTTAAILGRYLYTNRGFGIDRIYLGDLGVEQNEPGECGPALGAQDGIVANTGQITTLLNHEGALLWSLFNGRNKTTYIGRAYPNPDQTDINPLRHFYAEQVIPPTGTSGAGFQVTHMTVTSPATSSAVTLVDRSLYQLMFVAEVPSTGSYNFKLYYAPLPLGAGPMAIATSETDLAGQSVALTFVHNATSKFYFPFQDWRDPLATKYVRQFDTFAENVDATHTIGVYTWTDRQSATINGITNLTNWNLAAVADANVDKLQPAAEVAGNEIAMLALVTTPSPYTTAPHLKAISPRAKVVREVYDTKDLWIVLDRDHGLTGGQIDVRSPDAAWTALTGYANSGQQTFVDEEGTTTKVIVEQDIRYSRQRVRLNNRRVWRTIARVTLSKVS